MKVRDSFATLNKDETVTNMPSGGLDIIADDGRSLFSLRLAKDGTLEVYGGVYCKHAGLTLDGVISVIPRAANLIYVRKERIV